MDRVRNEDVINRHGIGKVVILKYKNKRLLRWFRHRERMNTGSTEGGYWCEVKVEQGDRKSEVEGYI